MPILSKQYETKVIGYSPETSIVSYEQRYVDIFRALETMSNNPWVVDHSCDGVTVGTPGDGINRLTDPSKIVRASSGPKSWIVYNVPAISASFQIMFHFTTTTSFYGGARVSDGSPYTGGLVGNIPTSATSSSMQSASNMLFLGSTFIDGNRGLTYIVRSLDGEVTRIFTSRFDSGNTVRTSNFFAVEKLKNKVSGFNRNWAVSDYARSSTTNDLLFQGTSGLIKYRTMGNGSNSLTSTVTTANVYNVNHMRNWTAVNNGISGNEMMTYFSNEFIANHYDLWSCENKYHRDAAGWMRMASSEGEPLMMIGGLLFGWGVDSFPIM